MEFLGMDFSGKTTALLREIFKFKKYKAMPLGFAIVIGILQVPFLAVAIALAVVTYVLHFLVKLFALPVDFIHGVVRKEKDQVRAGAETVVYLVSWPLVFALYVAMIFVVFALNVLYVLLSIFAYAYSLGGFRFHLRADEAEDIEIAVEGRYKTYILLIFVLLAVALLILLPLILSILYIFVFDNGYRGEILSILPAGDAISYFFEVFVYYLIPMAAAYGAFAFVYDYTLFARNPKACAPAPVAEAPVAEAPVAEAAPAPEAVPAAEAPAEANVSE